jgi:hypothetical protein
VLFETSGHAQQVGLKRIGMLSRQVGLTGIVDALADGTFDDIDPDRYRDIPLRVDTRTSNGPPDIPEDAAPRRTDSARRSAATPRRWYVRAG